MDVGFVVGILSLGLGGGLRGWFGSEEGEVGGGGGLWRRWGFGRGGGS
jgi:hypothetical protein